MGEGDGDRDARDEGDAVVDHAWDLIRAWDLVTTIRFELGDDTLVVVEDSDVADW